MPPLGAMASSINPTTAMITNLTNAVSKTLNRASMRYASGSGINGVQPDFVLETPQKKTIVIETKDWAPTPENQNRAIKQAKQFKEATGADEAFVLLDKLEGDRTSEGLISLDQLESIVAKIVKSGEGKTRGVASKEQEITQKTVFAAMPFSEAFDDVYFVAMAPAAKEVKASCVRLDLETYQGDIMIKVKEELESSIAIIADVTGANPNVIYEVGYAHALKKPTIHISANGLDKLPFDISSYRTIPYSTGQTYKLKETLSSALKAIVG